MTSSSQSPGCLDVFSMDSETILSMYPTDNWQSMSLVGDGVFEQRLHQLKCENYEGGLRSMSLDAGGLVELDNLNVPEVGSDLAITDEDFEAAVGDYREGNCEGMEMQWAGFKQPQTYPSAKGNSSSSSFFNGSVRPAETITTLKVPSLSHVQAFQNIQNEVGVGIVAYQLRSNFQSQSASTNGSINRAPVLALPTMPATRSRTSHQRKSAIEERIIAPPSPSPVYMDETASINKLQQELKPDVKPDLKPDIAALGINNGQRRTRRSNNSGDGGNLIETSHGHFTRSKKIRKYELPDNDDPTVKNAKAAKMNRERKKQEVVDLKATVVTMKSYYESLQEDLKREKDARLLAEEALAQEREKKQLSSSLSTQCSNLKDVLEGVVEGLQRKFQKTFKVEVDNRFAQIPASVSESGEIIAGFQAVTAPNPGKSSEGPWVAGANASGVMGIKNLFVNNTIPFEVDPDTGIVKILKPDSE